MHIIILGSGSIGSTLAEHLCYKGHDITLVSNNQQQLSSIQEKLDIRTLLGKVSHPQVLEQAQAHEADWIIAVTHSDELNMVACQVAWSLFKVPHKIARIRSPYYLNRRQLFSEQDIPIDFFISPERLIAEQMADLARYAGVLQLLKSVDDRLRLLTLHANDHLVDQTIEAVNQTISPHHAQLVALYRHDQTQFAQKQDCIMHDDLLFFMVSTEKMNTFLPAVGLASTKRKSIIIAGGGPISMILGESLEKNHTIKMIEPIKERCKRLVETLKNSTVIHANPMDPETLLNENIENADVFCALLENDEHNILTSMQAKRLGVPYTIAPILKNTYVRLIENQWIDVLVSPQHIIIDNILKNILLPHVLNHQNLQHGHAKLVEITLSGHDALNPPRISDYDWPNTVLPIALIHNNSISIPIKAEDQLQPQDRLILVALDDPSGLKFLSDMFHGMGSNEGS